MALIGNYSLLNRNPKNHFGGGVISNFPDIDQPVGSWKNRQYGGYSQFAATPNGYNTFGAYVLAMKSGGIASYVNALGNLEKLSAEMYAGRNLEGTTSSSITVTDAQLDQVIAMIANGILSMLQTNAGLSAAVGASADGILTLTTTSAQLGGIFDVSMNGTMTLTPNVIMTALANMNAEAGGPTPLSPEGLAAAVWAANIADNTESGTMGSLLLASGGGSSPEVIAAAVWDELLNTHTISGSAGERLQKVLTLAQFIGLK